MKGYELIEYITDNNLLEADINTIMKHIKETIKKIKAAKKINKYKPEYISKNQIKIFKDYGVVVIVDKGIENYAYVDIEDIEKIKRYTWHIQHGHAVTHINHKNVWMHRYVLNYNGPKDIDHINRNKLDNRKNNLRIVNRVENLANNNAIGVYKVRNKWLASIRRYGQTYRLGLFNTFEDAKKARIEKEIEIEKNKDKYLKQYMSS